MRLKLPPGFSHLLLILLILMSFLSALELILVRHENRRLFTQLQQLEETQDRIQVEWQQLQLEQSVWAKPARIEDLAKTQLHMQVPTPEEIIRVAPRP